jgi:ribonuclease HI
MEFIRKVIAFTDAACKQNPGRACIAIILKSERGEVLERFSRILNYATNNQAEYLAVLRALELALKYSRGKVEVFTDSKLLVKQLNGEFRIRNEKLLKLIKEIKLLELLFEKVSYFHVKEKKNREVHKLAKSRL